MSIFIVVLFLALIVVLLKNWPTSMELEQVSKPLVQLRNEYEYFHHQLGGIGLLAAAVVGFGSYLLLPMLVDYRLSLIADKEYTFKPAHDSFGGVGFLLGLLSGGLVSVVWGKYQLKDKWPEYIAFVGVRPAGKKYTLLFMKYGFVLMIVLVGAFTIHSTDHFLTFTKDSILVKKLLPPAVKTYSYDQIKEIRHVQRLEVPNGSLIQDPHTVIVFSDDNSWNFGNQDLEPSPEEKEFVPWLLRKTGKSLVELDAE